MLYYKLNFNPNIFCKTNFESSKKNNGKSLKFNSILKEQELTEGKAAKSAICLMNGFAEESSEIRKNGSTLTAVNLRKKRKREARTLTVTAGSRKINISVMSLPDSKMIKNDIYISKKNYLEAKIGDKVVCEVFNL